MRPLPYALILSALALMGCGSEKTIVLEDGDPGGVRLKVVRVAREQFNPNILERLARSELKEIDRQGVARVRFVVESSSDVIGLPSHVYFEGWRSIHASFTRKPLEIAELIVINGDAVLRASYADGRRAQIVLAGRNPLRNALPTSDLEILNFAFQREGPFMAASFFVRSDGPMDPATGHQSLDRMRLLFPEMRNLVVYLRSDNWFGYEGGPLFNPFGPTGTPPDWKKYSKTLVCYSSPEENKCYEHP